MRILSIRVVVAAGICAGIFCPPLQASTPGGASKSWTGSVSSDWSDSANWTPSGVPGDSDDVTIPAGAARMPALSADGHVAALAIAPGASLDAGSFTLFAHGDIDAALVTGTTGSVDAGGGSVSLRGTFPNLHINDTAAAGGAIHVGGTLDIGSRALPSELILGGDTVVVGGNFATLASAGNVRMDDAAALLRVAGNALFAGAPSPFADTAGTIAVGGNFGQYYYSGNYDGFHPSGSLTVVLDGTLPQTVHFDNAGGSGQVSSFANLRITNPTSVTFLTGAWINGDLAVSAADSIAGPGPLTIAGGITTVAGSSVGLGAIRLGGAMTIGGTFSPGSVEFFGSDQSIQPGLAYRDILITGTARLADTTRAEGNLAISWNGGGLPSGNLALAGHAIFVAGNFSTQAARGSLTMTDPGDLLSVRGDAVFAGVSSPFADTAGTIAVGGNFGQYYYSGNYDGFHPSGSLTVVLDGTLPQTVHFDDPGRSGQASFFANLRITNPASVTFLTDAWINGNLDVAGPDTVRGSVHLRVGGACSTAAGSTVLVSTIDLDSSLSSAGLFSPATAGFNGANATIPAGLAYHDVVVRSSARFAAGATTIGGNLTAEGQSGIIDIGTAAVTVLGNYASAYYSYYEGGRLRMLDTAGVLTVQGDFVADGSPTEGLDTAGTIHVHGNFFVGKNFSASGSHRLVFDGAAAQAITGFSNGLTNVSHIRHIEFANPSGVQVNADALVQGDCLLRNGATLSGSGSLTVRGALTELPGCGMTLSTIELDSSMNAAGSFSPGTAIFSGTNQTLAAGLAYHNVTVRGSARFAAGATTISGNLTAEGQSGIIDIGAAAVTVLGNYASAYYSYYEGGRLKMADTSGVLTVQGDITIDGSPTEGLDTAGTIRARGNFLVAKNFSASGSHRVVFDGAAAQAITGFSNGLTNVSRFQDLEFANASGVQVNADVAVRGLLISRPAAMHILSSAGHLLTTAGTDIDSLTLDDLRLAIDGGTVRKFDDVTFRNFDPAATQLTVSHPGAPLPFAFERTRFLTVPSTGYYISASDNASDGNVLTLNLYGSFPHDGSARTLTGGGAVVNWGISENPPPSLASAAPVLLRRGERIDVVLIGANFIDTATTVQLGAGITVDSLTFNSASEITAHVAVADSAAIGLRTVTVVNPPPGGGSASLVNILTVGYPRPIILSIAPDSVNRTATVNLTVKGRNLSAALTALSLGANIAINTRAFSADTQITANVTVGSTAAAGPRDVVATNIAPGGGADTLRGGLLVASPAPQISSAAPAGAIRGESGSVLITGLYYFGGTTSVSFGDSIAVTAVTVNDFAHLTAQVTIAPGAAAGPRAVTVTNSPPGGGTATLPAGFAVFRDSVPPVVANLSAVDSTGDTLHGNRVTADASDNILLRAVFLVYSVNNFASSDSIAMTPAGGALFEGTIPPEPLGATVGYYVTAVDNDGNRASSPLRTFRMLAIPVFDPVPPQSVDEGAALVFSVHASDANHDPVTYAATGLPPGASFADSTFRWRPSYLQSGAYAVSFIADDHHDGATAIQVPITVVERDNPPVVQAPPQSVIYAGQRGEIPFSVSDPDAGQQILALYDTLPPGATIFDPGAAVKFIRWQPGAADTGVHHLRIIAGDGITADTAALTISVILPPGPVVESIAPSYGRCGDIVALRGFAFGGGAGTMLFNGVPSPAAISGDTLATAAVPCQAQSGNVTLIAGGKTSNASYFTVLPEPSVDLEAVSCAASPQLAADGGAVTFSSLVRNHSGYDAQAYVTYFGGHPDSGGAALSPPQPITVAANGDAANSFVWSASPGTYHLYARVTGSLPPDPKTLNNTIDDGFIIVIPLAGGEQLSVLAPPLGEVPVNRTQPYSVTILNSGIDTTEVVAAAGDSVPGFLPASPLPFRLRPAEEKEFTFSLTLPAGTAPGLYLPQIRFRTATANDYSTITTLSAVEDSPKVRVRLLNIEDAAPVAGASCFADSAAIGTTDAAGGIDVPAGRGTTAAFTAVKEGFLPLRGAVANTGESRTVTLYMQPGAIVVTHVDVAPLTSQQIIDLGLNINDAVNYTYYDFKATVQFAVDQPPVTVHMPMSVPGGDTGARGYGYDPHFPCSNQTIVQAIRRVVVHPDVDVCPGKYQLEVIDITDKGDTCFHGFQPIILDETIILANTCKQSDGHTDHVPVNIDGMTCTKDVVYTCLQPQDPHPPGGGGGGVSASGGSVEPKTGVTIPYVVAIDGTTRLLKQFFTVTLALANQADPSFTLSGLQAALVSDSTIVPEGFPAASVTIVQNAAALPDLAGGQSASTRWVIRGDQTGVHTIKVSVTGTLLPSNIPISAFQYATVIVTEPPKLDVVLHHPSEVTDGQAFTMTAEVTNKSATTTAQLAGITLNVNGTAELAAGSDPLQELGDIPPLQVRFASWTLIAHGSGKIQACSQSGSDNLSFTLDIGGTPCPDLVPSDTSSEDVPPGRVVVLGTNVPFPGVSVEASGLDRTGLPAVAFGTTDANGVYRLSKRLHGEVRFTVRPLSDDQRAVRPLDATSSAAVDTGASSMPTLELGADNKYAELTSIVEKLLDTASSQEDFNILSEGWHEAELAVGAYLDSMKAAGAWSDSLPQTREALFRVFLIEGLIHESRVEAINLSHASAEALSDAMVSLIEAAFTYSGLQHHLESILEHHFANLAEAAGFSEEAVETNLELLREESPELARQIQEIMITGAHEFVPDEPEAVIERGSEVAADAIKELVVANGQKLILEHTSAEDILANFLLGLHARQVSHTIDDAARDARAFAGPDSAGALPRAFTGVSGVRAKIAVDVLSAELSTDYLSEVHAAVEDVNKSLTVALGGLALAAATPLAPVAGPVFGFFKVVKKMVEAVKHVLAFAAAIPAPRELFQGLPRSLGDAEKISFDLPAGGGPRAGISRAGMRSRAGRAGTTAAGGALSTAFDTLRARLAEVRLLVAADSAAAVRHLRAARLVPAERRAVGALDAQAALLRGAALSAFRSQQPLADSLYGSYVDPLLRFRGTLTELPMAFLAYAVAGEVDGAANAYYDSTKSELLALLDAAGTEAQSVPAVVGGALDGYGGLGMSRPVCMVDSAWSTVNGLPGSSVPASPADIVVHARCRNLSDSAAGGLRAIIHGANAPGLAIATAGDSTIAIGILAPSDSLPGGADETTLQWALHYASPPGGRSGISLSIQLAADSARIYAGPAMPLYLTVDAADADSDGMPDAYELQAGLDPARNDAGDDPDHDGLVNLQEYYAGTGPKNPDSDGDGITDGVEMAEGSNPLDAADPAGVAGKAALILPAKVQAAPGDTLSVPLRTTSGSRLSLVRFTVGYDSTLLQFRSFRLSDSLSGFRVDSAIAAPSGGSGISLTIQYSHPISSYAGINRTAGYLLFTAAERETSAVIVLDTAAAGWRLRDENNLPVSVASFSNGTVAIGAITGAAEKNLNIPKAFELYQNYPNPFNPRTMIRYDLPRAARVTLRIYNLLGQEVATLADGMEAPGERAVAWNAGGYASGVYFCRLEADGGGVRFVRVRKLLLVK